MADNIKLLPLPEGNVAHLIAAQSAEIERLSQQRDELRAALRNALPVLEFEVETRGSNDRLYEIPAGPVLDAARAAIAKAEGR